MFPQDYDFLKAEMLPSLQFFLFPASSNRMSIIEVTCQCCFFFFLERAAERERAAAW